MVLEKFNLSGRVVLVTGGSRGIGRALALGLASAGADVAVVSRSLEQGKVVEQQIEALGRRALAFAADVTSIQDAGQVVDQVVKGLGRLDVLVNNAGLNSVREASQVSERDWDQVIDVNLKAVFFWSQAAAKKMVEQGSGKIINVSSVGGVIGESKMAPYAASKAGVISLTKSLAREWGRYNIQVNSLGLIILISGS